MGRAIPGLSGDAIQILKKCFISQPGMTHCFINHLICSSSSFDISNKQLQLIYKDLIDDLIQKIKLPSNSGEYFISSIPSYLFNIYNMYIFFSNDSLVWYFE